MLLQVEVTKYENAEAGNGDPIPRVVRSCITSLPPGYSRIDINEFVDDVWGVDGYDT